MDKQNWIDPEGTDSRGWTRTHRETEDSSPEGIKRTAYGTDFSNPQGQYEYQEWNGQRNPIGEHSGQWPEQKDYNMSSPEIKSETNRPQDRHQNAQSQQTEQTQRVHRDKPNEKEAKLAEPDSGTKTQEDKSAEKWDSSESNQSLGEDGQYDANRDSKYGTGKALHDPQY